MSDNNTPSEGVRNDPTASGGHPKVGYLTIVFANDVSAAAAKHLIDELASEAISYNAVDAVRCDVGEFDQGEIDAFWDEAQS